MRLKKISLVNFKNIAACELVPCEGINCIVGGNGAGKTNVVDAVHYLSMGKSALSMTDGQCVRHGEEFFVLTGDFVADEGKDASVSCGFKKGHSKTLKYCGKEYQRLSDHIGVVPLVVVSPADGALVSDSADERRRWLNSFISQLDHPYLDNLIRYNRLLAERNTLLKQGDMMVPELLDVIDERLDDVGRKIAATRSEVLTRLAPLVERYYAHIADDHEPVAMAYRSELNKGDFLALLRSVRQKDICMGFTTIGVHRDDVVMTIGGYPLRKYGSQGQQKSFLIALKLAQYKVVAEHKGERPILLLDDLFDKLDAGRVEQLIKVVSGEEFGQIFITDCNKLRLQTILDAAAESYRLFSVGEGHITQQ